MQQHRSPPINLNPLSLFKSNQTYHTHHTSFKTLIKQQNPNAILSIITSIYQILLDDQYNPYSKLLAMRFIKEIICIANYPTLTLINSLLEPPMMEILISANKNNHQNIGEDYFIKSLQWQPSNKEQDMHLRTVGVSFCKIIAQIYETFAQTFLICPFNIKFQIPSNFASHYQTLKSLKINFPSQKTYIKQKDIQKMNSNYQTNKKSINQQTINTFLTQICQYSSLPVLEQVIKSGNQQITNIAINLVICQQIPIIQTIHRLLKTGDIQSVILIQKSLIQPLIHQIQSTSNQQHHHFAKIWSQWAKNNPQTANGGLAIMGDFVGKERDHEIEIEVKRIQESYQAMRDKNNQKLKHIKFSKANTELLHQILHPKPLKDPQSQPIKTSTQIQLPQQFSPTTSYLTNTPKSKLSSNSGSNLKINMSSFSASSQQKIRQPIKLSGRKLIRKSSFSSSKPAQSEREISVRGQENSKNSELRPDYFTVHPNGFNNVAKDAGSSSQSTHKKKQILKPKTLLYKNSALQIGLLCSVLPSSNTPSQMQLQCNILYTSFTFLTNISFKVICPSWLYLYSIEGDMKMQSFPEIQSCMKIIFGCKIGSNFEQYSNKTWIQVTYTQNSIAMEKIKLEMPIMINKFCENIDIDANDFKILPKGTEYSGFVRLNKICRTFDDFLKYFPKSIILNDPKIFLAKLSAFNNKFYLHFKVVSKNEAIIKLIPTNKKQNSAPQMHQTILSTFLFLFGA